MAQQTGQSGLAQALKAILLLLLILSVGGIFGCLSENNGSSNMTPTPAVSELPATIYTPLPDLIIIDISLRLETDDPCTGQNEPMWVQIGIRNQGDADSGPFEVEVNDTSQSINDGLQAGKEISLRFSGDEGAIRALVDAAGQVDEYNEMNNQISRFVWRPTQPATCMQTPTPLTPFEGPLVNLEEHNGKVLSVDFSPDGTLVASGSVDDTMRLWRTDPAVLLRTMREHPFPVLKVQFTPNNATLVSGSTDGLIRLWSVSNGLLLQTLEGHAGWITSLDIDPQGQFLASSSQDFTVRIWRLSDGRLVQTIDEGMSTINSLVFSPNGQTLAWAEESGILRIRTLSGTWLHILNNPITSTDPSGIEISTAATCLAFTNNGTLLVAGYADGMIQIWDSLDGTLRQSIAGHDAPILDLEFSPDGNWLVTASEDHTMRLWRIFGNKLQNTPTLIYMGHTGPVNSLSISPRSDLIASGSDDGTVRFWAIPKPLDPFDN